MCKMGERYNVLYELWCKKKICYRLHLKMKSYYLCILKPELPGRLKAGQRVLVPLVGVRILPGQQ